jgi:DNA-binding response OmpR family regulator/HPt (histidine-containing phosphotransfer) domain-containing protein
LKSRELALRGQQNPASPSKSSGKLENRENSLNRSWVDNFSGQPTIITQNLPDKQPVAPVEGAAFPMLDEIMPEMMAVWQQFKEKYRDRVTVLEEVVKALGTGSVSEELRHRALAEAHTLVGSLGSFGLNTASRLSRAIEHKLEFTPNLNPLEQVHLSEMVVALRQALEQSPGSRERGSRGAGEAGGERESIPSQEFLDPALTKPGTASPPRLLVVDDDAPLALGLMSEATAWGMQAEVAITLSEAREVIARTRPDVILLDLCFPDSVENGFGLLAELARENSPIPVLVFTAQESFADRVKVARLGGRGFLHKPVSPTQVMEAIAQVLQQSNTPQAKLLIVDDDPQLLDFLRTLLEPWGFKLTLLDNPQEFWNTLEQAAPDLLILDVEMPELSGIDLCQVVRNDPHWSDLPVLVLSASTNAQTVHQVFTAGADDYVNKPIVGPELVARVLNRLERSQIRRQLNNSKCKIQNSK